MSKYSNTVMKRVWDLSILDVADKLDIKYGSKGGFRMCKCFMHDDQTPSMWLKVSNNTWSCAVCSKGGGIVSLVREHENLSFDEAVEWLIREFKIWVYDDNDKYRPLKSSKTHQKPKSAEKQSTSMSKSSTTMSSSTSNTMPLLNPQLITKSLSTDGTFCQSLVSTGILTDEQMRQAASLYHLGLTHDGGVIFWSIDDRQQLHEGKIMWYTPDCHRDHTHNPSTISSRLISRGLLTRDWKAQRCFFGLHLLRSDSIVAIVESEKTAVICSQLLPQYVWLSCGGLSQLLPEMFLPIRDADIVVFPDTDPGGDAFNKWTNCCRKAMRLIGRNIYVSNLLELHATDDQKRRKIDIADFIIESKTQQ